MTTPQVELRTGSGYDLLVSAVAVADPSWRAVMSHGPAVLRTVRADGGAGLARDAARFGRFGWINLIGYLAESGSGARSRSDLIDLVSHTPSRELHFVLAGGRRHQLQVLLDPERLRAALRGNALAEQEVRRVIRSPRLLLEISRWLLETRSSLVRNLLVSTISRWPSLPVAATDDSDELDPGSVLARVTKGIHYGPAVLDRVVLVASELVEPILISVDQQDVTVIVHPPVAGGVLLDSANLLRQQGNAVGDETRISILQELRHGSRTLPELTASLGRPRTTLLHHLALLRAAGFVTLMVTANEPNAYHLDRRGFDQLSRSAQGFVLD